MGAQLSDLHPWRVAENTVTHGWWCHNCPESAVTSANADQLAESHTRITGHTAESAHVRIRVVEAMATQ